MFTAVRAALGLCLCLFLILTLCLVKPQSTRHGAQPSLRRPNNHSHGHTCFDQGLDGTNLSRLNTTTFPGLDNVNSWDASLQSLLTPSTLFNPLSAASDLAPLTTQNYLPQSTTRSRPDSSDGLVNHYPASHPLPACAFPPRHPAGRPLAARIIFADRVHDHSHVASTSSLCSAPYLTVL